MTKTIGSPRPLLSNFKIPGDAAAVSRRLLPLQPAMVSQRPAKPKSRRSPCKRSLKRTPPRIHSRRGSRPSPLKSIAASIDSSVRTCRRRLIKLFTCLTSLASCAAPAGGVQRKIGRNQGFVLLSSSDVGDDPSDYLPQICARPRRLPLPPLLRDGKRRTLFLDLDETLVHSQTAPPAGRCDFVVRPTIGGQVLTFYVVKRPGVEQLLEAAAKQFEVVLFTAGVREYASLVLDRLDPGGELISHRLYRDSCSEMEGVLVKDLSDMGRELSAAVIVDDNPNSYALQPGNAVPVAPFVDDPGDRELWRVMDFIAMAGEFEDTRDAVRAFLSASKNNVLVR